MKARDPGRRDAPGKVLKDRRSPRRRGRMGTSVWDAPSWRRPRARRSGRGVSRRRARCRRSSRRRSVDIDGRGGTIGRARGEVRRDEGGDGLGRDAASVADGGRRTERERCMSCRSRGVGRLRLRPPAGPRTPGRDAAPRWSRAMPRARDAHRSAAAVIVRRRGRLGEKLHDARGDRTSARSPDAPTPA